MTNREWIEMMADGLLAQFLRTPFRFYGRGVWDECRCCQNPTVCCGDHPCADAICAWLKKERKE